jgi:AraC-like DNA-binding protein
VPEDPVPDNKVDTAFWEKVCEGLEQNYRDPDFSPDMLAAAVHMSQRSLQRKIKALADRTPVKLISEFRLRKAATLLRTTEMHVTDIAFDVGFGDLSHFYRLFKKEFGVNPSTYRNEGS